MLDEGKTGSNTYYISKLTENNYRSWSQKLRWILDEKELLDLVEGREEASGPLESESMEGSE
jgi:hypothetical protein